MWLMVLDAEKSKNIVMPFSEHLTRAFFVHHNMVEGLTC
jgi:hypothetical protein